MLTAPWVDAERAFGTAEREAGECALHGHEQGEGFDFVEFNLGVVANPTFIRAEHIVVLHAVAFEELPRAVIHFDGAVDHNFVLRLGQDKFEPMRHVQCISRL